MNSALVRSRLPEVAGARAFDPGVLRAFGEVARTRFGLARMAYNSTALARRLRAALGDPRCPFAEASRFVAALWREPDASPVVSAASDTITNRDTWFFRDHCQLGAALSWLARARAGGGAGALRALSAGCSSGEEVLSVAMLALDRPEAFSAAEVEVRGFDLSPTAVARARAGEYRQGEGRREEPGPPRWEQRFFRRRGEVLTVRSHLAERTRFEVGNVLRPSSEGGAYDLVLCRNVLIYFDRAASVRAIEALVGALRPGGLLLVGAAEAALVEDPRLTPVAFPAAFQREAEG